MENSQNETFVETTEEELHSLLEDSKSKNTNRSTKTSLTRFKAFLQLRKLPDVEDLDVDQLPQILTKFYTDVRTKKTGEQYQTGSFKVLRAGLNRYFKLNKGIDIVSDEKFMRANMVFDGVQVKAKKQGKGVTRSTHHISPEDLSKIGTYFAVDHMNEPQPRVLQHAVQFFIMYFFCRRGQENLYEMTKDYFKVVVEPDGTEYVIQSKDEKDKNHGVKDTEIANQAKMYSDPGNLNSKIKLFIKKYQLHVDLVAKEMKAICHCNSKLIIMFSDSDICPVNTFKLYISKLNKNSNRLWQKPRQGYIHFNDEYWYEKNPVGQKMIESFMKRLATEAKLDCNDYTNHSIRATCIGTLDSKGFEARHITAISSHKSESTIKTYSTKCPDSKKREMYDALNASVIPKGQRVQHHRMRKAQRKTTKPCQLLTLTTCLTLV